MRDSGGKRDGWRRVKGARPRKRNADAGRVRSMVVGKNDNKSESRKGTEMEEKVGKKKKDDGGVGEVSRRKVKECKRERVREGNGRW